MDPINHPMESSMTTASHAVPHAASHASPATAVLLIDVQESFRHRPYWNDTDWLPFLERTNALLDGAAARGLPIVRILHTDGPATADNPFSLVSGHVRPMDELAQVPIAAEFLKEFIKYIEGGKFVPKYVEIVSSTPDEILNKAAS